jgi:hypothetical protein
LSHEVWVGVGPYLSIYLKGGLHWESGEIGIAMAVSSITAAICQIPAGLLVDSVRAKRLLVVISGIMVGIGSLLVVCLPKLTIIVGAQATLGAASRGRHSTISQVVRVLRLKYDRSRWIRWTAQFRPLESNSYRRANDKGIPGSIESGSWASSLISVDWNPFWP